MRCSEVGWREHEEGHESGEGARRGGPPVEVEGDRDVKLSEWIRRREGKKEKSEEKKR